MRLDLALRILAGLTGGLAVQSPSTASCLGLCLLLGPVGDTGDSPWTTVEDLGSQLCP